MKNVLKKVKGLIPNLRERLVLFKDSNDGASIVEVVLILVKKYTNKYICINSIYS